MKRKSRPRASLQRRAASLPLLKSRSPLKFTRNLKNRAPGNKIPDMPRSHKTDEAPLKLPLAVALCLVLFSQDTWAYFDPATGSILLQALLAGLAGAALMGKLFFIRIKDGLKSLFTRGKKGRAANHPDE